MDQASAGPRQDHMLASLIEGTLSRLKNLPARQPAYARGSEASSPTGWCCAVAVHRSLTVTAPIGAARVSKRFRYSAGMSRSETPRWVTKGDAHALARGRGISNLGRIFNGAVVNPWPGYGTGSL